MALIKRDMEHLDRWHRNQGKTEPPKRGAGAPEGNKNRLKHGIFADRCLNPEEKEMFDIIIEQLHQDFQFNKSSDFIQVELVGVYSVKLVRAQMEGNTQAAESLDRMIRCHMKDLKTTKVAREGQEPKGPKTSPSEWAATLIEKVSEVAEKKPAKKTYRKKPKKSSDNTAAAKKRTPKNRQLRRGRMSKSARNSLFQEILIEKNFSTSLSPTEEGAAIAAPGQWGLGRFKAVRGLLPVGRPQGGCKSGW